MYPHKISVADKIIKVTDRPSILHMDNTNLERRIQVINYFFRNRNFRFHSVAVPVKVPKIKVTFLPYIFVRTVHRLLMVTNRVSLSDMDVCGCSLFPTAAL
jgi:hypothetical protein